MKQVQRLAIIGFDRLGRTCARAIQAEERFELAGIVRRAEKAGINQPRAFSVVPVVSHVSELKKVEAALVCVPTAEVFETVRGLLQHRIPVVDCVTLHGEAFQEYKRKIDRLAIRHEVSAIVGAGWDPGALSLFRSLFALLAPKGNTEVGRRAGISLHHSTVAGSVPGVKAALSTEICSTEGKAQRYLYVEPEAGEDEEEVARAVRNDPLFLGEEVLVFMVESVASIEEEDHGITLERYGIAAATAHQHFLLEARFSELALTAQVMLAAACALPTRHHRAYSLFDLPFRAIWGELQERAEREWI